MGKVTYSAGIDKVQGALSRPKKTNGHTCGSYLIGTHRTAPSENGPCSRLYIKQADAYTRSTQPSNDELAARSRFAAVRLMVKSRARDLEHIQQDQTNFLAQKDLATGKKTMNAYLWKIMGDQYDAQQH